MSLLADRDDVDSPRIRRWVVDRLAARLDALAKEMADAYVQLAAEGTNRVPIDGFRASEAATQHLLYLLRSLATDGSAAGGSTDELSALASLVTELAAAGHSLPDVLDAHGACFLVAWRALEEELEELPEHAAGSIGAAMSRALVAAMARSSVVVSEAFESARKRTTEAETPDILGQALEGGEALVQAMRRAEVAGWPVGQLHTIVVAACERVDPGVPANPAGLRRLVVAIENLRPGGRAPLTCNRDGSFVVAFAGLADGSAATRSWRSLVESVVLPAGYRLLVGIGLGEPAFGGVIRSHGQARRALDLASTYPGTRVVVSYAEVLPQLLLLQDPLLTEDLHRLTLGPLERADGATGNDIVASLRTYLDRGLNIMAAAKELLVHRHTLTTRLDKVEQLTGLRVERGEERLLLELGLQAKNVLERTNHSSVAVS